LRGKLAEVTDTNLKEDEEDTKTKVTPTEFYTNIATCIFFHIYFPIYFLLPYKTLLDHNERGS